MPTLTAIAALSRNRVIGAGNRIPWHIPDDFKHFKRTTMGHPIIMGRKTFESLGGKPLPGRPHIIISRTPHSGPDSEMETITFVPTLDDAINLAGAMDGDEIFICGGAQIYALAMPRIDRMILTLIDRDYDGDTYFPAFDPSQWHTTDLAHADTPVPYVIRQFDRIL